MGPLLSKTIKYALIGIGIGLLAAGGLAAAGIATGVLTLSPAAGVAGLGFTGATGLLSSALTSLVGSAAMSTSAYYGSALSTAAILKAIGTLAAGGAAAFAVMGAGKGAIEALENKGADVQRVQTETTVKRSHSSPHHGQSVSRAAAQQLGDNLSAGQNAAPIGVHTARAHAGHGTQAPGVGTPSP